METTELLPNSLKGSDLLEHVKTDFIGLNVQYQLATGELTRRVYLDSTASTLMMGPAYRAYQKFMRHYSNTHSEMHFSAKIATEAYHWAHDRILRFLGADQDEYTCFFTGSGTTSGMNRVARAFNNHRPDKNTVLVSIMEHHSNDLPHRKHGGKVIHIPVDTHESRMGCIDTNLLEKYLQQYHDDINYVSITGISNVTGIINPIDQVADLAHKYGAYIVVDGAQMAAHVPVRMGGNGNPNHHIDAFVFSGHKTYAPGSPGVVVIKKSFLENQEPEEVGGGMVGRVFPKRYIVKKEFPDREEAGTPNIPGGILLASAIEILDRIGMENILEEDISITNAALKAMLEIDDVVIYGDPDTEECPRACSISFNVKGMDHGQIAAILNDYYNIAVRNECFCAHPYVEKMMELSHAEQIKTVDRETDRFNIEPWMGMVRVSFGLYNTFEDVDYFINALAEIVQNREKYILFYRVNDHGDYEHKTFRFSGKEYFNVPDLLDDELKMI